MIAWILIVVGLVLIGFVVYRLFFDYAKGSEDSEQRKKDVSAKYSTEMNRFAARKEGIAAEARTNLVSLLNQERAAIDFNEQREADLALHDGARQVEFAKQKSQQLELQAREQLLTLALAAGVDITTYLQVSLHRELKQIDLEARAIEYTQDQENIDRVEQIKLGLIDRATHRLFSMYEQRKQIEASNDPAKDDKLSQLNYNIKAAEDLIRGEQDRFIQATLGQEERRSLSPNQRATGDSETPEAGQNEVSA